MGPRASINPERSWSRTGPAGLAGVCMVVTAGVVAAIGFLALGGAGTAHGLDPSGGVAEEQVDVAHTPPLLTTSTHPVTELRYDIYCTVPGIDTDSGCDAAGTVYVRRGRSGAFRPIPLRLDPAAHEGRYVAELPADIAGSQTGFSYYTVIRDTQSGASTTLPAGGASAPQESLPLVHPISVDLGVHRFGAVRLPSERVAAAAWGNGQGQAGIEEGPELQPIGASSFDVDGAGTVTVLDEANRRLLRFASGRPVPSEVSVDVRGTIADLSVRPDGGALVLESVAERGETPRLRAFDAAGHREGSWQVAQPSVSALRRGPAGLEALAYPAGQWLPVLEAGAGTSAATQLARGHAGRSLAGGGELVVQRVGAEARIAVVDGGGVRVSWLIHSVTPLAEVQLAEPLRGGVVVVLRVYTDERDEFVALVLGRNGIERQFSLAPAGWAETAPLGRFRLVGSSLYQLGSTPAGMFVDRFDLEVQ